MPYRLSSGRMKEKRERPPEFEQAFSRLHEFRFKGALESSLRSRRCALAGLFGSFPRAQTRHSRCRRIFPVLVLLTPLGFRGVVILSHVLPSPVELISLSPFYAMSPAGSLRRHAVVKTGAPALQVRGILALICGYAHPLAARRRIGWGGRCAFFFFAVHEAEFL
jgi:hypothetical protein